MSGNLVQGILAGMVLVGGTLLATTGVIEGSDIVTLYGIVLGYVFGTTVGRATEQRDEVIRHNGGSA